MLQDEFLSMVSQTQHVPKEYMPRRQPRKALSMEGQARFGGSFKMNVDDHNVELRMRPSHIMKGYMDKH